VPGRKIVEHALTAEPFAGIGARVERGDNRLWIGGLIGSSKTLLAAVLRKRFPHTWVIIAPNLSDAEHVQDDLLTFLSEDQILLFSEWETLPYERRSPLTSITESRLVALSRLMAGESLVVVTTPKAIMQRTLPRQLLEDVTIRIERGQRLELEKLTSSLADLGYRRIRMVEDSGEFSVRGGIVDVLPFGYDEPIRIELAGDEVESIRQFEIYTQRSTGELAEVVILPRREVVLAGEGAGELGQRLSRAHRVDSKDRDHLLNGLETGFYFEGVEQYLPAVHPDAETLVDYLPDTAGLILVREDEVWDRAELISLEAAKIYSASGEDTPLCEPESLLLPFDRIVERFGTRPLIATGLVRSRALESLKRIDTVTKRQESFGSNLESLRAHLALLARDNRVWIMCDNRGQITRLGELLSDAVTDVALEVGSLEMGFSVPGAGLAVYTDHDIFDRYRRRRRPRFRGGAPISSFEALTEGDYVVHVNHGIGQYVGMERVDADDRLIDCIIVEYAEGGRLYVPADEIDRLQKYVGKEEQKPRLNKLGGIAWTKTKARAKKAVEELARDLLNLYAARRAQPGISFPSDNVWQRELEASFIYEDTEDQLRATEEIKTDMESAKPMDRLICGDVGFGKTEVAIRAAFKAVMAGKQVAVLVPTTILAQQHMTTFHDRFAEYPVEVDVISRFRTAKEQKEIVERLGQGKIDVIIGTHRIISKDVKFKDLGLLIIDEEQQFGVLHKETIQQIRKTVDVLTMTATPIPRTLHMAIMGARDMSLIVTPPRDRLPVRTEIATFDDDLIVEAVMREIDRGGQVYFVHNRVQTIEAMASYLRQLLPEIIIDVGHGQMPERQLETVMLRFLEGKVDVLVCSMIIESGLDIPNVNTIIINRADRFGLAQLYQLRGRVGRSNHRAYAYLLIPRDKSLSAIARKRLGAIQEFTDLSSGYKLAMRDLEIRGAGNILGAEQHGHMMAVGFNLYARLLREAVRRQKGEAVVEELETTIHIKVAAYIPDGYMPDNDMKLDVYKRIRDAGTEKAIEALRNELDDRFGRPPDEVGSLLDVQALRVVCRDAGVQEVRGDGRFIIARFASDRPPKPSRVKHALEATDVEMEFDATEGLAVRFEASRDRREALRIGRKVLKGFAESASV